MRTSLFPARARPLRTSYLVVARFPSGPWDAVARRLFSPGAVAVDVAGLADLDAAKMTDFGMWVWAAILTVLGLVAAFIIAVAWQRWKDSKKQEG